MTIRKDGMSIKEMLAAGVDPNEIMREFQNQMLAAQKEIDKEAEEKKKNQERQEIKKAQNKVVDAVVEYGAALDIFEKEDTDNFRKIAEGVFDDMTNEYIKARNNLSDKRAGNKEGKDEKTKTRTDADLNLDRIIDNFLKNIKL